MTTVAFHTLGCKVNHYESEAMMDLFKKEGYQIVDFENQADVYIINSCTVTNEAARKSRQLARKARRVNSEALVAMVGCYTQVSPEEVGKISGIDLLVGTSSRNNIVELVEGVRCSNIPDRIDQRESLSGGIILPRNKLNVFEELKIEELRETTRAYVKIEEGCNQFCSYCIIPYARGPVRSREISSILEEVKELTNKGVKEIVLTGTHLGAFGYDWNDKYSLLNLLEKLLKIDNLGRIRLSSIEVTEVSRELLEIITVEEKLCPHLHLPLQSGSDKILKDMKRPYTTAEFRAKTEKIRDKIPEIALTTDLIVGFPGETKRFFQESYQFVKEIEFSRLHVFPYSPREGTPAANMKAQIPGGIKREYSKKIRGLNEKLMLSYQQRFLGQERQVIIEEKREPETGFLSGVTDNYIRVLINEEDKYMGRMVKVRLTRTYNYDSAEGRITIP